MLFPKGIEARYRKYLKSIVRDIEKAYKFAIVSNKDVMWSGNPGERFDTAEDIERALFRLQEMINGVVQFSTAERSLDRFSQDTSTFATTQVNRQLSIIGISLGQSTVTQQILTQWVSQNTDLIKSIGDDVRKQIATIVRDGFSRGLRWESVAKSINGTSLSPGVFKKARNRAQLIARDQVASLNGNITKTQMQRGGVNAYIWRDSDDARVRQKHANLDGKIFSWGDKSVVDGVTYHQAPGGIIPGSEINCRCVAEAYFGN